jgi:hypothetical protein
MIPKSRFDEVNERARKAEEALEKLRTETQAAEQARLAKQGEWQQVAEQANARVAEYEPFKNRAVAAETVISQANEALIAQIPEDMRESIVPILKRGLPPHELYAWLTANVPALLKRPAPNIDAGSGAAGGGGAAITVTDADRAAAEAASANGYKVTPEEIAKRRSKK